VTRPLHIFFTTSGASSLRHGLELANRSEDVIGFQDDWSQGPIDSDDLDTRLCAVEETLDIEIHAEWRQEIAAFWQTALDATRPRVVWFSRWSTMEYCGFLEWLRRNGDAPFSLVDLSDAALPDARTPGILYPIQCATLVTGERFAEHALWDRAVEPQPQAVAQWTALWNRLRAENAPLRVLTPEGLVSAPIDHFDRDILACAEENWMRALRVVGEALYRTAFEGFRERGTFQCSDFLLFARLRHLAEVGALEGQGDPYDRDFKVRLPSA
jgi:hypothetical protein